MKKLIAVLGCLMLVTAFAVQKAEAQTLTSDVVFLKIGYVPVSATSFKDGITAPDGSTYDNYTFGDLKSSGFAIQGEYNINFNNFWIGVGLEYQRLSAEWSVNSGSGSVDQTKVINQFIQPMVSAKLTTFGGLYVGAGLSVKYLMSTEKFGDEGDVKDNEWKKTADLWGNIIIGYYLPIAEAVFFDVEARFGINMTNNQFEKDEVENETFKLKPDVTYDIAFYAGIGYRAFSSDY